MSNPVHTLTDSEIRSELDRINRIRNRGIEYPVERWRALNREWNRRRRIDREARRAERKS